jgi:alkanesulfonate monooxygenase SsuD/methylene tetrahydromethanopterin reductase-like flavin-dependent oxidoreductase (luciferase family)
MVTVGEQPRIGTFRGSFWSVDLDGIRLPRPVRPTLPITVAPLRAAMTEMAAEVADGILGHPVWSPRWISGEMHSAVERGLALAGRQRSDIRITAWLRVAITDDIEQGRADARVGIPFYASLRQYDSYFAALGLADDARRLQDLSGSGASPAEQSAAVSDAMADELVMIGPADEIAARIADVLDVVDDVCITPPNGLPPERTRRYDDAIAGHLLPGGS